MPKLSDFHINAMALLSVVLPGSLVMAALVLGVHGAAVARFWLPLAEEARWVAFALAAYAAGHFVYLIASTLDEWAYEPFRNRMWPDDASARHRRKAAQVAGTSEGAAAARSPKVPFRIATELRQASLDRPEWQGAEPINTFRWAKLVLLLKFPAAHVAVESFEADSKFFRSLVVALPVAGFLMRRPGEWLVPVVALLLALLSFLRYAERRHKAAEWAFQSVIVLLGGRHPATEPSADRG